MAAAGAIARVKTSGSTGLIHCPPPPCAEPLLSWRSGDGPSHLLQGEGLPSHSSLPQPQPPTLGDRSGESAPPLVPRPPPLPRLQALVGAAGRWLGRSRDLWTRHLSGPGLSLTWASIVVLTSALRLWRLLWIWFPPV